MVTRFHLPGKALVKYLVIDTGDTVNHDTFCTTSEAFSEPPRLTTLASAFRALV